MDDDGGGGASPELYGGGRIRLVCENCRASNEYSPDDADDEGRFTCDCGVVHNFIQVISDEPDFTQGKPLIRRVPTVPTKPRTPYDTQDVPAFGEPDEPRDFVHGAAADAWGGEPEETAALRAGAAGDPAVAAAGAGREAPGGRARLRRGWDSLVAEISEAGRKEGGSDPDANLQPSMKPDGGTSEEFGTRELLRTLADAYDKIDVAHDYSKDLHSYLKYCKDVVFPGIAYSDQEKHLIENFQDMYKGGEDEDPKAHMDETRTTNAANKRGRDGTLVSSRCFSASSSSGIRSIKSEMEDHGFCYMQPRKRLRSDGYLHYRRKTTTGSLACVGHADYYMLIRSFAKLVEVDVRIVHASALKLERRLAWIEERIGRSLDALHSLLPSSANDTMA